MPQTIQNEAGEDVEVFTAEELEAQKASALEEFKAANPDKNEELTKLQADLAAKEEELAKFQSKDLNFSKLRDRKEAAEKDKAELLKQIDEKIGTAKKEVLEGVLKDNYNENLKALAGEDAELQKKIELQYNRLTDPATTKEEVARKLRDAWVLATKLDDPGALNTAVISSGNLSRFPNQNSAAKLTPEDKELGAKFGLTAEDLTKYGQ